MTEQSQPATTSTPSYDAFGLPIRQRVKRKAPVLYVAIRSNRFGIGPDGGIYTGLKLIPRMRSDETHHAYDDATELVEDFGPEADLIMPPEGLREGAIYEAVTISSREDDDEAYAVRFVERPGDGL